MKNLKKNRNGIQKQIEQKNWKNLIFFNLSHNRLKKTCLQKNLKNDQKFLNFSVNFPQKKKTYTKKTEFNWYLNIS